MSKITNVGYTDSPIAGNPVLVRGKLNFGADFRVQKEGAGEMTLTNITSPLDRKEVIMYNVTDIKNIYDKTDIHPSVQAPNARGINLYTKVSDIYAITDSTDANFLQHLPVSASITIRIGNSEYMTAEVAQAVVARCVSTLYETDSVSTTRLNSLLRGAIKPSDL